MFIQPRPTNSLRGIHVRVGLFMALMLTPIAGWAGLNPDAAPPGATVTITGKGFGTFKSTKTNQVKFNGLNALIQRWEGELIEVRVPLHAADGPVDVFRGKKRLSAGTFTVQKPSIKQVSPREAEAGAVIQVEGAHFGNTAGSKDPNTMFGVNQVLVGGAPAKIRRWRDDRIEVEIPSTAQNGDVVVRLASSDPLPDGSCCAPVEYIATNPVKLSILTSLRMDPDNGPAGTKVAIFGRGLGSKSRPDDLVLFNGRPATIAKWEDTVIVVHVPLNAESGPVVLHRAGSDRDLGRFTVHVTKASKLSPESGPIGSLLRIHGEHFGIYSESGDTEYAFMDFNKGDSGVEIGGVPAIVHRWNDDRVDVWVPYSVKSGPVIVKRGATIPKPDGTCCADRQILSTEAGTFTVVDPQILSYEPKAAGADEVVTIKGAHLGTFLKGMEATQPGLNEGAHDHLMINLGQDVARSEVLFNGVAGMVLSWTDTEIKVRVPRRPVFGVGGPGTFVPDMSSGPLVVRRGSWDLQPDGTCCTPKRWVTLTAGPFKILTRGMADQSYWTNPDPNTNND